MILIEIYKESAIELFNFVVLKSMKTKITELAALRPLRGLRLTSYSSFNFRHLWLHFTYCSNMRSSYSRYKWSSLFVTHCSEDIIGLRRPVCRSPPVGGMDVLSSRSDQLDVGHVYTLCMNSINKK